MFNAISTALLSRGGELPRRLKKQQRAAKTNQFNLMYVLTVIASCGGGNKAESRRQVSANALAALILLVG